MDHHERSRGRLRGVAAAALVVAATGCGSATYGFPEARSEQAKTILGLWRFAFVTAAVVGALTLGLILWSVFRYRAKGDEIPRQTELHIPLEIVYTVVPVVIVAVLFGLTYRAQRRIDRRASGDVLQVEVTGFMWQWRFHYPAQGVTLVGAATAAEIEDPGPTLVLPVDQAIRVRLTSTDVIHAFWVPDFLFKKDNIPGRPNEFELTVSEPGTYVGRCAEFCGLNHSRMTFTVVAVPADEFAARLATAAQQGAG